MSIALPVSLNPCENLERELDDKIHQIEQEGTYLRSQVEDLRKELQEFGSVPSTQEALNTAVAGMTADEANAGTTAIATIRNFSGTCLDTVYNNARKYTAELDHYIIDSVSDITSLVGFPEVDMLTPLNALKASLGISALTGLIAYVDEKLGCLANQGSELGECLNLIDNFNNRVNDVITYLGFGADGTFDLDDFISNFNINMDTTALDNLKGLEAQMTVMKTEIQQNISDVIPSTVVPSNLF